VNRDTIQGRALTRLEAELDAHYKTLPLWSVPRPEARFAVLAAFDLSLHPLVLTSLHAATNPFAAQRHKAPARRAHLRAAVPPRGAVA